MWSTILLEGTTQLSIELRLQCHDDGLMKHHRNFDLEDVHVEGTERIAEAVAKYDVDRFIHVSSYNADKNSSSEFFRTKVYHYEGCR